MLTWETKVLPDLTYMPRQMYSWRSRLVIVCHAMHGIWFARLYATENKEVLWWQFAGEEIKHDVDTVLGWMPESILLPLPPERSTEWTLKTGYFSPSC